MCEHSQNLTPETCSMCIAKKNGEDRVMVESAFEELRDEANSKVKKVDKKWSDEEIQFLKDNVNKMKNREMGEHIGRTTAAVGFKMSSLGIVRKKKIKPKKASTQKRKNFDFDIEEYYLGKLCKNEHKYLDTGQSLRRRSNRSCLECSKTKPSIFKLTVDFSNHADLLTGLKELAGEQLRTPENQALWMLADIQKQERK